MTREIKRKMPSSLKALDQAIAIECKEVLVSWSSWLENQRRFSPNTRIAYLHDLAVFLAFLSKHFINFLEALL